MRPDASGHLDFDPCKAFNDEKRIGQSDELGERREESIRNSANLFQEAGLSEYKMYRAVGKNAGYIMKVASKQKETLEFSA
jgi:hypothetical protein